MSGEPRTKSRSKVAAKRERLRTQLAEERAALEAAREEHERNLAARTSQIRLRNRLMGFGLLAVLLGTAAAIAFLSGGFRNETLNAVVRRAEGGPVDVGERCTVAIRHRYAILKGELDVHCSDVHVYRPFRWLACDTQGDRVARCEDDRPIRDDGSPRLLLDLEREAVTIGDESWELELAIVPDE